MQKETDIKRSKRRRQPHQHSSTTETATDMKHSTDKDHTKGTSSSCSPQSTSHVTSAHSPKEGRKSRQRQRKQEKSVFQPESGDEHDSPITHNSPVTVMPGAQRIYQNGHRPDDDDDDDDDVMKGSGNTPLSSARSGIYHYHPINHRVEAPPLALEAKLAVEDDDDDIEAEYAKQVEKQVEAAYLSNLTQAEAVGKLDGFFGGSNESTSSRKLSRRRTSLLLVVIGLAVGMGVTIGAVLGVRSGRNDNRTGLDDGASGAILSPPTFTPVAVDPTLSQDRCENAVELQLSASDGINTVEVIGFTGNSTFESTADIPICGRDVDRGDVTTNGIGVFYKFVGTGDIAEISLCDEEGGITNFDTQVSIYESSSAVDSGGDCSALQCVAANDQRSQCGIDASQVFVATTENTLYYIVIHGKRSTTGTFGFRLQPVTDTYSTCPTARRLVDVGPDVGKTAVQSIFGTTKHGERSAIINLPSCAQFDVAASVAPGTWYEFEAKSTRFVQAQVNDVETPIRISVFAGNSCDSLTCVSATTKETFAMWTAQDRTRYHILVQGAGKASTDDFVLSIKPGGVLRPDPDAPVNTQCELASPVPPQLPFSMIATTQEGQEPPAPIPGCGMGYSTSAPSLYYSVKGTGHGLKASTCSSSEMTGMKLLPTQLSVYRGSSDTSTCQTLECVGAAAQNCGEFSAFSWHSIADATYIVRVSAAGHRVGSFNLTVEEVDTAETSMSACSEGISLEPGMKMVGSVENADIQYTGTCEGPDSSTNAVWYTIQGTGNKMIASTCDRFSEGATGLVVHVGTCHSSEPLRCMETAPTESLCGAQMSTTWDTVKGEIYSLQVYGSGKFTVEIDDAPISSSCTSDIPELVQGTIEVGMSRVVGKNSSSECSSVPSEELGVWYRISPGNADPVSVSTCHPGTNVNTTLRLFAGGSCGSAECEMTNYGANCEPGSSITWEPDPLESYYLLVQGTSDNDVGLFEVSLGSANDVCESATPISPNGLTYQGSTSLANRNAGLPSCFGSGVNVDGPSVFFSVIGTGTMLSASTCSNLTNFDTRISVYGGESCTSLTCLASNDNFCGEQSTVSWYGELEEMYFVVVHGAEYGDFGLIVEERPNDVCVESQDLPFHQNKPGTGNTFTSFEPLPVYCTGDQNEIPRSWLNVIGTGSEITIDVCQSENEEPLVSILSSDCSSLTCIEDNRAQSDSCRLTFDSTFDESYNILVQSEVEASFSIDVNTSNDSCERAVGPLLAGSIVRGSNERALPVDGSVPECEQIENRGSKGNWYVIEGRGSPLTLFTCSPSTDFDTQITAFTGRTCNSLLCLDGKDDNCGIRTWLTIPGVAGEMYYILVSGKGASEGNFVLEVSY